jgi:hypothetical protein
MHPYVDPGSGALVWQMLTASVVGMLFNVRRVIAWMLRGRGDRPR